MTRCLLNWLYLPALPPWRYSAAVLFSLWACHGAVAQINCPPLSGLPFGPWERHTAPKFRLEQIESFHFNRDVELLMKGQSSTNIGHDLEYVLLYIPNHHRALNSMMRLGKQVGKDLPPGNKYTIDCWFQRARTFRPKDGMVNLLYSFWLVHRGRKQDAIRELAMAHENMVERTSVFEYNLGLAYLEVGDFENALQAAHNAYAMGSQFPGLRDRLKRAGKWREPPPGAPKAAPDLSEKSGASAVVEGGQLTKERP